MILCWGAYGREYSDLLQKQRRKTVQEPGIALLTDRQQKATGVL